MNLTHHLSGLIQLTQDLYGFIFYNIVLQIFRETAKKLRFNVQNIVKSEFIIPICLRCFA
jgi:hypothetical protein